MPVSTCFAASGENVPSAFALNWMKRDSRFDAARAARVHQFPTFRFVVDRQEIEMDLGARAAGAGVAHHPEIILLVAVDDVDLRIEAFLF